MSAFPRRAPNHTAVSAAPVPRELPRSAVTQAEQRLALAREKLAQAKRRLRDASVREQSIREGVLGRAVLDLIDQGQLEQAVIDLIRVQMRAGSSAAQLSAFTGTVFA